MTSSLLGLCLLLAVSTASARPLTRSELGELFLFGIPEAKLDSKTEAHLKATCPGSLVLFRRNLVSNRQTIDLTQNLRKLHRQCSQTPLLIGLDQEGGQVARVPFDPPMPSAWALGSTRDTKLSEEVGYQVGITLRKLGFNLNLAPVLDLGSATQKTFIGSRSFGSDPANVGQMGAAFSMGLIQSGVLPVAKHFPGIGSTDHDPHRMMVRRPSSTATLWDKDMKPFQEFAELFPTGVMPSHLVYPQLDKSQEPGTFSSVLLQDWLREKMNYQGLIVSDDLLMKGAGKPEDFGKNVVAALKAGVDLVMVTWSIKSQAQAIAAVEAALKNKFLTETSLRQKIARIRKVKQVIGEPQTNVSDSSGKLLLVGTHRYTDLAYDVLKRNLQREFAKLSREKPQRLFLWPNDLRSKWQMERGLHQAVHTSDSPEFKKIKQGDLILAFAKTKKEAREIAAWPLSMRRKTIVINQVEPGLFDSSFHERAEIFLDHPMLSAEVARELKSRWGPALLTSRFE